MPAPEEHTPREATITVSASDSLLPDSADFRCDGTADEVQIQAAIDALPAMGGKVLLLEGNYVGGKITIEQSDVTLEGQGESTIYTLADNTDDNIIECGDAGTTAFTGIKICNLKLDGNKANQAGTSHGIFFNKDCRYSRVDSVTIVDALTDGIHLTATGAADKDCSYSILQKLKISGCTGNGIYAIYAEHLTISKCPWISENTVHGIYLFYGNSFRLENIFIYDNGERGLYLHASDNGQAHQVNCAGNDLIDVSLNGSYWNTFSQLVIESASPNEGMTIIGGGNVVMDSYFPYSQEECLVINGDKNKIIGNIFGTASQETNNTFDQVRIAGSSADNEVSHNIFWGDRYPAGNHPRYGLSIDSTGVNNIAHNNHFTGFVTAAIYNTGLNTGIYHQYSDLFIDVLASSANYIVNAQNLVNGAVALTGTQPKYPRGLVFAITEGAPGDVSAYTMTVVGTNAKGETITEVFTFAVDGLTWSSDNAFDHITSVTLADVVDIGAATFDVGIDERLGLMNVIYEDVDIWKIIKNGAKQVVAVAQVDVDYDIYDMSVITLAATDDFEIWYRHNLNIIA